MNRVREKVFAVTGLAVLFAFAALAAAQQPSPGRVLGTVTAVSAASLTVKTDAGAMENVAVSPAAKILRTAPGQRTLAGATKITLAGIAPGDRVLMLIPGNPPAATVIIVNKASDLAAMREKERKEWQQGAGGLVKSVDAAAGTVTVVSGGHPVTIHSTPSTIIRRYAPDSVKFSDAQPSTLAAIHPGDQLQARGTRNASGTELTADEIVSGSFRYIAGLVASTDASAGTFTVKDWKSKKTVTVHTTADSDMRRLNPRLEERIAMALRSRSAEDHKGKETGHENPAAAEHAAPPGQQEPAGQQDGGNMLARLLARSPEIHVADLHKGDAVMIVATAGNPHSATAFRVVAGVEAMLRASARGSQNMFSSAWSLGGGAAPSGAGTGDMGDNH